MEWTVRGEPKREAGGLPSRNHQPQSHSTARLFATRPGIPSWAFEKPCLAIANQFDANCSPRAKPDDTACVKTCSAQWQAKIIPLRVPAIFNACSGSKQQSRQG
jgi:hypothetical protein